MRTDLTDIVLVVDRSGSMTACQKDAEGGVNTFIDEQKKVAGEANLTLVQFDTEYEFIHKGAPIKDVGRYSLVPRGMTALLDAVGKAINETGERLAGMAEDERPGAVVFVIVTDGEENSSKEFKLAQIKQMIEHQRSAYNWQFSFLGADENAFDDGASMGIARVATAQYDPAQPQNAYMSASCAVARTRCALAAGGPADLSYTDDERKSMA